MAKRAAAFGMTLHYHNRKPVAAELSHGATYHPTLDGMLPHCDFLSINCASTAETRDSINARAIGLLPQGAIVVNAARGDIVNDEALIAALKSGKLAAAGLDVFKGEPNIDPALPRHWTTCSCCRISAAPQKIRASPWACGRSIIWKRFSRANARAIF